MAVGWWGRLAWVVGVIPGYLRAAHLGKWDECTDISRSDLFPDEPAIRDRLVGVDSLPDIEVVQRLGEGMSGVVDLVRTKSGYTAVLKQSRQIGHPLLRGYAHLLDAQSSPYVPKLIDYYKLNGDGDSVFMERVGPTLHALRVASGNGTAWPSITIGSIGLQLFRAMKQFHTEFGFAHRDACPSNLAVAFKVPRGKVLPERAMIIDFDFSASIHAKELQHFDIRQLLVSLRYLFDGNAKVFWSIDPKTGGCRAWHTKETCLPGPVELCDAMEYACNTNIEEEFDYDLVENLLGNMLTKFGHEDKDKIIWPYVLAKSIRQRLA